MPEIRVVQRVSCNKILDVLPQVCRLFYRRIFAELQERKLDYNPHSP